jgi:hypothetical protein
MEAAFFSTTLKHVDYGDYSPFCSQCIITLLHCLGHQVARLGVGKAIHLTGFRQFYKAAIFGQFNSPRSY